MTMINKETALELGYFFDETDTAGAGLDSLADTLRDGVILPSMWQMVDDDGEPLESLLDPLIGYNSFASFVEIPRISLAPESAVRYGLGFSTEFLQAQEVEPVTYIHIDPDEAMPPREEMIREGLETLLDNWDSIKHFRQQASTAIETLRADPLKRAYVRDMLVDYANDTRTFYEIVPGDPCGDTDDAGMLHEWRGTSPIHFTLEDVQSIYVASLEDVTALRAQFPTYTGIFVVLS